MFYENFIKKIDSVELKDKNIYKYSMNFRKKFLWSVSGVSMLIISAYSFYIFANKPSGFAALMGGVMLLMAGTFIWSMFSYRLEVDRDNRKMILKKNEINMDEIESGTLKLMVPPGKKYLEPCIDVIIWENREKKEKIRVIVPLIMGKKDEFTKLMKVMLKERFSVEKV